MARSVREQAHQSNANWQSGSTPGWAERAAELPVPRSHLDQLLVSLGIADAAVSHPDKLFDSIENALNASKAIEEDMKAAPSSQSQEARAVMRAIATMYAVSACRQLGDLQDKRVLQASVVRSFTKKIIGDAIGYTPKHALGGAPAAPAPDAGAPAAPAPTEPAPDAGEPVIDLVDSTRRRRARCACAL